MKNSFVFYILLILIATSCSKSEEIELVGERYFPSNEGHFKEYIVDSTIYFESVRIKNVNVLIREETSKTFLDSAGKKTQHVRVLWSEVTQPARWKQIQTYSINVDNYSAQEFKNNRRSVKLSFPMYNDKKWNVNAYSNMLPVYAVFEKVFEPFSNDNFNFGNTVTVTANSPSTLNIFYLKEVYSENIGLVERYLADYEHQKQLNTKEGFEVTMKLRAYN